MKSFALIFLFLPEFCFGQQPVSLNPPFTFEKRLEHYFHRTYGLHRLCYLAGETALDFATDTTREWGDGTKGYGTRYAYSFGRRVVRNTLELGLTTALGEDNRYQRLGSGRLVRRVSYSVVHTFAARTNRGSYRPAYSRFAANLGTAFIAAPWHPRTQVPSEVMAGFGFNLLDQVGNSLLDEYCPDMKKFGRGVVRKIFGK